VNRGIAPAWAPFPLHAALPISPFCTNLPRLTHMELIDNKEQLHVY
jgi:hypothetical protein